MLSNKTKITANMTDSTPTRPTSVERRKMQAPSEHERRVVASLAHEINNSLEALRSLLYFIDRDATPDERHRYVALAQDEAHRISQISHAAMNQFRDTESRRDTNVPELLNSVLDFYKSRFESQGISVSTRYCREGNLPVYAPELRQMLSNLLLNAADAMPEGGRMHARISKAHEWRDRERRGLRLTIADDGCGIAPNDLPKVLEPFFTTKGSAGTGIGLSLVKDTVQKHGGLLRVRSSTKPDRSGSVFTIFLPRCL